MFEPQSEPMPEVPCAPGGARPWRIALTSGLFPRYGSTKTGLLAAGSFAAADLPADCAGQLPPWVDAQTVDEEGRPLPDGATGRLCFRSMEVAEGYFEDPQASAERFRDGWFMPGDMGRIGPERTLYLEGPRTTC